MAYSPKHSPLLQGFIHCFVTGEGFYLTPLEQAEDYEHIFVIYELHIIT